MKHFGYEQHNYGKCTAKYEVFAAEDVTANDYTVTYGTGKLIEYHNLLVGKSLDKIRSEQVGRSAGKADECNNEAVGKTRQSE